MSGNGVAVMEWVGEEWKGYDRSGVAAEERKGTKRSELEWKGSNG